MRWVLPSDLQDKQFQKRTNVHDSKDLGEKLPRDSRSSECTSHESHHSHCKRETVPGTMKCHLESKLNRTRQEDMDSQYLQAREFLRQLDQRSETKDRSQPFRCGAPTVIPRVQTVPLCLSDSAFGRDCTKPSLSACDSSPRTIVSQAEGIVEAKCVSMGSLIRGSGTKPPRYPPKWSRKPSNKGQSTPCFINLDFSSQPMNF